MKLPRVNSRWLKLIRTVSGAVIIVSVGIYFYAQWDQIKGQSFSFHPVPLMVSWLLFLLATVINTASWVLLLGATARKISPFAAAYIFNVSLLMRYVPGKVWQIYGRINLAGKKGIPRSVAAYSIIPENIAGILGALVVGFAGARGVYSLSTLAVFSAGVLSMVALTQIGPRFMKFFPRVPFTRMCLVGLLQVMYWTVFGGAFFFTARSLFPQPLTSYFTFCSAQSLGWLAGMASVIAPNGIGVREGVASCILVPLMPLTNAILAATVFRMNYILSEVTVGGILIALNRLAEKKTLGKEQARTGET